MILTLKRLFGLEPRMVRKFSAMQKLFHQSFCCFFIKSSQIPVVLVTMMKRVSLVLAGAAAASAFAPTTVLPAAGIWLVFTLFFGTSAFAQSPAMQSG